MSDPSAAVWLLVIVLVITETVAARRPRAVILRGLGRGAVMLCAFLVPALLVANVWSEGRGGYYAIGGLVPWSDGSDHYQGAVEVKDHAKLGYWNQRRPLNAAINSIKLRLGGNLKGWIAIGAFLLTVALALAVRETWLLFGLPAAAVLIAIVCSHAAVYLHTTMSETNGLFFGLLAAAILLAAIRLHSGPWFLCGLFLVALALDIRPGAMFVLPVLWLWGAFVFGKRTGERLRILALAILVTILGFVPARLYGALWGDGRAGAHSNYALTLYGLAAGNRGWHQAYADYPPARFATEQEYTRVLNARSMELIRANPWRFAKTLGSNLLFFLARLDLYLKQGLVVTTLALLLCLLRWREPSSSFLLAVFAGVLLSAPFLVRDAEARLFAATVPLTALIPAFALTFLQNALSSNRTERSRSTFAPIAAMALAGVLITAPLLAAGRSRLPSLPPPPGHSAAAFVPGGSGDWIDVLPDRVLERSRVPLVRESDVAIDLQLTELRNEQLGRPPFSFGLAIDARDRRTWFVTPSGVRLPRVKRPLLLVGDEHLVEAGIYYLAVKEIYELSSDRRSWMPVHR